MEDESEFIAGVYVPGITNNTIPVAPDVGKRIPESIEERRENQPIEVATRGVKSGLRQKFKSMTLKDFHRNFSHMGRDPTCHVCKMVKGNMRRIKKMVDPHRETRPGHTWGMDIVTFSDRSKEGCKYCVVLRDFASGAFKLLPVARRTTEALSEELMQWIRQMRNKPIFANMPYRRGPQIPP